MKQFLFALFIVAVFAASAFAADVTPKEAFEMLKKDPKTVLIDVRTPEEFAAGHFLGAENVNFLDPNFRSEISKFDRNKTYLLVCRSGKRSKGAEEAMKELGFKHVKNVLGGMTRWTEDNVPLKK